MGDFLEAIQSGDKRKSLEAMRDAIAREFDGNRCKTCQSSLLRAGDQAALYIRLLKIIDELEALPVASDGTETKTGLALIRSQRTGEATEDESDDDDSNVHRLGTKRGPRKQGGRRVSR
jgi:hypothetical protein